jgi:hypothetical protein
MAAAAVWPASERDDANTFFDNVLGNGEIYEKNSGLMFSNDGSNEIEACMVDISGTVTILP